MHIHIRTTTSMLLFIAAAAAGYFATHQRMPFLWWYGLSALCWFILVGPLWWLGLRSDEDHETVGALLILAGIALFVIGSVVGYLASRGDETCIEASLGVLNALAMTV